MLPHKHTATQFDTLVNWLRALGQENAKGNAVLRKLSLIQVEDRYFLKRNVRGRRFCGISRQIVKNVLWQKRSKSFTGISN